LQRQHAVGDLAQIYGGLHARPLAREVEQRLHDATGAHRFAANHLRALLHIALAGIEHEGLPERGDRGQRIVQLVRHSRHQRAQLGQPVRLQQALLQQRLARHVQGEEQELGRLAHRIHVHDHRAHLAGRLAGVLDGEVQLLALRDRLPQRGRESTPLGGGRPVAHGTPP